jgi:hypothetical protein
MPLRAASFIYGLSCSPSAPPPTPSSRAPSIGESPASKCLVFGPSRAEPTRRLLWLPQRNARMRPVPAFHPTDRNIAAPTVKAWPAKLKSSASADTLTAAEQQRRNSRACLSPEPLFHLRRLSLAFSSHPCKKLAEARMRLPLFPRISSFQIRYPSCLWGASEFYPIRWPIRLPPAR